MNVMNVTQLLELILLLSVLCSATMTARNRFRRQQARAKFRRIERRLLN
jgi:hypothetical protein